MRKLPKSPLTAVPRPAPCPRRSTGAAAPMLPQSLQTDRRPLSPRSPTSHRQGSGSGRGHRICRPLLTSTARCRQRPRNRTLARRNRPRPAGRVPRNAAADDDAAPRRVTAGPNEAADPAKPQRLCPGRRMRNLIRAPPKSRKRKAENKIASIETAPGNASTDAPQSRPSQRSRTHTPDPQPFRRTADLERASSRISRTHSLPSTPRLRRASQPLRPTATSPLPPRSRRPSPHTSQPLPRCSG